MWICLFRCDIYEAAQNLLSPFFCFPRVKTVNANFTDNVTQVLTCPVGDLTKEGSE